MTFISVINTRGSEQEVRENIMKEFVYQSTLELAEETYNTIQSVPLVTDITQHARQNLIRRLDNYTITNPDLFKSVISLIKQQFVPIFEQHFISGEAHVRVENNR